MTPSVRRTARPCRPAARLAFPLRLLIVAAWLALWLPAPGLVPGLVPVLVPSLVPVARAESLLGVPQEPGLDAALPQDVLSNDLLPDAAVGEADGDTDAAPIASLYDGPRGIRPGPRPDGRPLRLYRNARVDGVARFFLEDRRDVLERGWRRSGRYLPMIRRVFREEGVPEVLCYLAAVESNFNPLARSPARAVGLWQFTAPTARTFGLRMYRPWYDERLDPESSTRAAARLLAYLYDRYERWELALAAYNAGEARVNAALEQARRHGRPPDYWSLNLPEQTEGFVPSFLAVAAIMEAPQAHGLDGVERDAPLPAEGLELTVGAALTDLAGRIGVPAEALLERNPAWRGGLVPPFHLGSVLLWLPPGTAPQLVASLAERPPEPIPWLVHRVQEGETVSHIARAYGVQTGEVLALNQLGWHTRLDIGQPLLVPVAASTPPPRPRAPEVAAAYEQGPTVTQMLLHRVQSGESLWTIARQYGVRMAQIQLWNGLGGSVLRPDQELVVYLPADWAVAQ